MSMLPFYVDFTPLVKVGEITVPSILFRLDSIYKVEAQPATNGQINKITNF